MGYSQSKSRGLIIKEAETFNLEVSASFLSQIEFRIFNFNKVIIWDNVIYIKYTFIWNSLKILQNNFSVSMD